MEPIYCTLLYSAFSFSYLHYEGLKNCLGSFLSCLYYLLMLLFKCLLMKTYSSFLSLDKLSCFKMLFWKKIDNVFYKILISKVSIVERSMYIIWSSAGQTRSTVHSSFLEVQSSETHNYSHTVITSQHTSLKASVWYGWQALFSILPLILQSLNHRKWHHHTDSRISWLLYCMFF